nr:entry exclusion protein TrbK [Mycoplana azooxidifex]
MLVAAATASGATFFAIRSKGSEKPMSEERRVTREKFFGSKTELPSIEKGQEMRPRW